MSASEKLKALDEAMQHGTWRELSKPDGYGVGVFSARGLHTFRNALPQIVAVVEAAESPDLGDIFDDTTMYPAQKRLAAALVALDEALG